MALAQKHTLSKLGNLFDRHDASYETKDFRQGVPETRGQAVTASLKQMVSRVDENAFSLVDYAEKFIARRDMHVRAINDLVLSTGPYLTSSKAYATALMAYGNEVDEKVQHILAMRDIDKNTRTLNTAKEVVAVNDLKETAGIKPHDWCHEQDCLEEYEAAFKKHLRSHPRKYGKDSRGCRVTASCQGLIRKYGINMSRRTFREQAELMGFHKYR